MPDWAFGMHASSHRVTVTKYTCRTPAQHRTSADGSATPLAGSSSLRTVARHSSDLSSMFFVKEEKKVHASHSYPDSPCLRLQELCALANY
jgi:hypothetical protein